MNGILTLVLGVIALAVVIGATIMWYRKWKKGAKDNGTTDKKV